MSEPRYGDYCGFCKQKPCKCQEKYLADMDELHITTEDVLNQQ